MVNPFLLRGINDSGMDVWESMDLCYKLVNITRPG